MKLLRYRILRSFILAALLMPLGYITFAQDKKNEESAINDMIQAKRFIFKAQSAMPSRGSTVQLNYGYDVVVTEDTVKSYLPFFGRAYTAPMNRTGGGYDFLSKDFEYNQRARRKGGWDISIKPKDVNDVRELLMTVFVNGSSTLRVLSNNRETIAYHGQVTGK